MERLPGEQNVIAHAKKRLAADPTDVLARKVLEDVANGERENFSFAWFTFPWEEPPEEVQNQ